MKTKAKDPDIAPWLTVKEAAARVGRSQTAIRVAMENGHVAWKKMLGQMLIHPDDLDAYYARAKQGRPKKGEAK